MFGVTYPLVYTCIYILATAGVNFIGPSTIELFIVLTLSFKCFSPLIKQ